MKNDRIIEHQLEDIIVRYIRHEGENGAELELVPADKKDLIKEHRELLTGTQALGSPKPEQARILRDNLMQLKLHDEPARNGFANGVSMFDSFSAEALCFSSQEIVASGDTQDIQTVFEHPRGLHCMHHVTHKTGEKGLRSFCEVTNTSDEPLTLELLSSFVLSGITPFDEADAPGRLQLHRFRSWWSIEGKLETRTLEELHLVRSWTNVGTRTERIGQVGFMPVRHFFPFIAAEDTEANVTWGAKLAWAGSWQMEAIRRGDTLTLTGGHADREFGHWKKTLASGETLTSPVAMVACTSSGLNDLCHRFLKMEETRIPDIGTERDLPIMFNEWCTTWGSPTYDKVLAIADRLKELDIRYFVIDDGWAERPASATMQSNGDWIVDQTKFPGGLKPVGDALRERGMIPGVWFEFEVCNPDSKAWKKTEHHLHRDGIPFTSGTRRFWDFNDPWVQDYLGEKLIRMLQESGFGYLKVDYNDTIGIGCDHPDSLGEGLRQQVLAVQEFFRRLKREVPGLVIENCASGGHRLEPSMMELVSMGSFSDAHEAVIIPAVAAVVQKLIPPRQSQIWAVLHESDSPQRMVYSLTATCLGRMCLSGDVLDFSAEQMKILHDATAFYRAAAPVIKNGCSELMGDLPENYTDPVGWQAVCRLSDDEQTLLIVLHSFHLKGPQQVELALPSKDWKIETRFTHDEAVADCENGVFKTQLPESYTGAAYLLRRVS